MLPCVFYCEVKSGKLQSKEIAQKNIIFNQWDHLRIAIGQPELKEELILGNSVQQRALECSTRNVNGLKTLPKQTI